MSDIPKDHEDEMEKILVIDETTLAETIPLNISSLRNIIQRDLSDILTNNIKNFDNNYDIGGATNKEINNILYQLPVLTSKDHKSQFFPYIVDDNLSDTVQVVYHKHTWKKVKKEK